MKINVSFVALWMTTLLVSSSMGQTAHQPEKVSPAVLGKGVGLFELGPELARDDFESLENWVVQIQQNKKGKSPKVAVKDQSLDCFVPGRGCTVWFKEKLKTRVTISYDVVCPGSSPANKNLLPRDINNFWMAGHPGGPGNGIFDPAKYTGDFSSYDKMHGYYASTGGGKNTTTRLRRYPREVNGIPAEHLALTSRDGDPDYLITPDKVMRIQLVAYDDVIQYIVDEKLVYEMGHGDKIQIEGRDAEGKRVMRDTDYDPKRFPVYREGYFGFRMVGTHHIYSNFRVHALQPARPKITVSSIKALREAMTKSDQHVVMKAGTYVMPDLINGRTGIDMSGSNNVLDLSGVTIRTPISLLSNPGQNPEDGRRRRRRRRGGLNVYLVSGDQVTIKGGTFETPHPAHTGAPIDFGSYNQDPGNYPASATTEMRLEGDDIHLINCKFTVRGSSPYGYGNMYGIGGDAVVELRKHSGILMTGDRIIIDRCQVKMESFGHAIFVQGGDQITVRHCEVEGEVRPSKDLYKEVNEGDLPKKFNYQLQWPELIRGLPIPKDHMINLSEDGIRAYSGTGHMTVEHCKVTKARGGIKLYMAKSAKVSDCEVIDCVVQGFSLPSRGSLLRSRGNAAFGPLLYIHSDSHSSQQIELEVIPAPHALGDHPLAAIKGRNHKINFTSSDPTPSTLQRPIIVGYPLRFDFLCTDYPKVPTGYEEHFAKFAPQRYRASEITLHNGTGHPVVTGKLSQENRIFSVGKIRDDGTDNFLNIQAEK